MPEIAHPEALSCGDRVQLCHRLGSVIRLN
jgi:hypothetical protein